MAAADAAGNKGVERAARIGDREVTGNDLAGLERLAGDAVRLLHRVDDPGEVHHLAQAHHLVTLHLFGNIGGGDRAA